MTYEQYLEPVLWVLSWTLRIAIPLIAIILLMYFYDWYKKKKNYVHKEPEKIIVKMNDQATEEGKEIANKMLESEEVNEPEAVDYNVDDTDTFVKEEINYESLTLKELYKLPEVKNIKGFTRMKKDDLIKKLK